MLVSGVLAFAVTTFFVSFLIGRTGEDDKGKLAALVTLFAWTSLAIGLYLGRMSP